MTSKFIIVFLIHFQVAYSQHYCVPALSYPSYSYNNYYYPATPALSTFVSTNPVVQPGNTKAPKRSVSAPPKCAPKTASAYFLSSPSEKIKATILPKEIVKKNDLLEEKLKKTTVLAPSYSCPLCNNFADVPPNPKIPPPPPIGSPVLPGIIDKVPTINIPKEITQTDYPDPVLSTKTPLFLDMCEKHRLPKNLSFDQELLEGFLTGLGLAL